MMIKKILSVIILFSGNFANAQIQLPYNRMIQPAGIQIYFGDYALENHALDAALSPDGKWLAVEERYSIVFISTSDNKVKYILKNNTHPRIGRGMNTYSGIIWRKGTEIPEVFWSTSADLGRCYVASATWNGTEARFSGIIEFKPVPPAKLSLPNEILIVKDEGTEYLYTVLNGNNQVV